MTHPASPSHGEWADNRRDKRVLPLEGLLLPPSHPQSLLGEDIIPSLLLSFRPLLQQNQRKRKRLLL